MSYGIFSVSILSTFDHQVFQSAKVFYKGMDFIYLRTLKQKRV